MRNEDRKRVQAVANRIFRWLLTLDPLDDGGLHDLRNDWLDLLYMDPTRPEDPEQMWNEVVEMRAKLLTEPQEP